MEESLPPHIIEKEKTPFYFGEGEKHVDNIMLKFFKYNDYQLLKEISKNDYELNKLIKALDFNFSNDRTNVPFIRYVNAKLLKNVF